MDRRPNPGEAVELDAVDEEVVGAADGDGGGGHVDVDDVVGLVAAREAEAATLADRDELDGGDRARPLRRRRRRRDRAGGDAVARGRTSARRWP